MGAAGRRRHLVEIVEDVVTGTDSFGQQIVERSVVGEEWISIEPLTGRDLFNARQVQPDTTHKIGIKWPSILTSASQRLEFEGRSFEIFEPPRNVEERNRDIEVLAKERE